MTGELFDHGGSALLSSSAHSEHPPALIDTVWRALRDPKWVAPCFPGATITSASGDEFAGIVKARLGPISLQYRGPGRFTENGEGTTVTVAADLTVPGKPAQFGRGLLDAAGRAVATRAVPVIAA